MENIIFKRNQSARSIRNVLSHLNEGDFNEETAAELRGRLAHLKSQWANFANKNAMMAAKEQSNRETRLIFRQYDEIEEDYLRAKAALRKKIKELNEELQHELNDHEEMENISIVSGELNRSDNEVRQPYNPMVHGAGAIQNVNSQLMWQNQGFKSIENTWGEFHGSLIQWQGFHDRFKAAVHDNELIPRAFKFQYLKNSLKGQAAVALGEWQLSDENYNEAWERLKELYEREYQTSRQLLWKLVDLPRLELTNGFQIQKYCNTTHEVLRQLKSMKYPVEHYDMFLVHLLHDRLDAETSKAWELQRASERPKIQDMLKFLDSQAKAISGVHFFESKGTKSLKKYNASRNSGSFERKPNLKRIGLSKPNENSGKSSENPKMCKLCAEPFHQLFRCEKFKGMNVLERKRVVRDHELCNNCLKPFHVSKDCFGKPCLRCDKKHNSLLCPENPQNQLVSSIQLNSHKQKNKKNVKQYQNKSVKKD